MAHHTDRPHPPFHHAPTYQLLLLVPELKYVVGSVVLPVLGALPDGAIILFSGPCLR